MDFSTLLSGLKVDLGISTDAYDERLTAYLENAAEAIGIEGITLDPDTLHDQQLVIMYAAWMWRRRDKMETMPRMLRYQLNNRLATGKMNG